MKQTWETLVAFKLVWLRVLGYVLVPSLTTFLAQTETWSGETWRNTEPFLKWRLLGISLLPGVIAFMGFIDQSMARARDNLAEKRRGDTERFIKEHTGP